ncbi:MAG: hypothetical protein ISS38_03300 [Candidatus Cloacimonetes bacterium]|nr:hypothetical protein [Candidatus Cloacimonadota bacterium]
MIKSRYLVFLIFFVVVTLITIMSCGRKGTLNPNNAPTIEISEYSGISRPDTIDTDSLMFSEIDTLFAGDMDSLYANLFYQEIFWNASDNDGWIEGYAYRIGTWDSTATEWYYDKAFGTEVSDEGWVLHEQPNGEMDIWTSHVVVSAKVYFPSTDTTDFKNNFGKFEVKCKDDRGDISNTAAKYFCTWSDIPSSRVSTSQDRIDSCRVGTAILFKFNVMDDNDPFGMGSEAAYFKYRLMYYERIGADTLSVEGCGDLIDSTGWFSTENLEDTDEVLLMENYPDDDEYKNIKPILRVNEIDEVTQIQLKTIDKAGLEDPTPDKMTFFVRGHFTPETCPFMSSWTLADYPPEYYNLKNQALNIMPHIYVLGKNTYLTYLAEEEEIPSQISNGEFHYANQFYMDKNEEYSAIWSDNIEIYLRWEYLGEFEHSNTKEREYVAHTYHYDSNLDEYQQYFCDIEFMDIQLDGTTDGLPPLSQEIVSDESGDWMRIPIYEDQNCKLFDIESGEHTFKVRAVDYQGAVDPTPESLVFTLHEKVETAEKSEILVIDDTKDEDKFSVEDSVDTFYEDLLEEYTEVETFDLEDLTEIKTKNSELRNDEFAPSFAPSDIQNYKFILWHANNPKSYSQYNMMSQVRVVPHYDVLRFHLESGGNLLFTGCAKICDPITAPTDFLQEYAGLADTLSSLTTTLENDFGLWGNPNTQNSVFAGANGSGDFSEIDSLNLNTELYLMNHPFFGDAYFPEYWFPLMPDFWFELGAIGNVTFLNLANGESIFTCIPSSQSAHEQFEGVCVGSKYQKSADTGIVYILGFPLYYIEPNDAKDFIDKVITQIE